MYKAILVSTDGEDMVTAYRESETVEEVENLLANQGSSYYFYPFHAVVHDNRGYTKRNQRLVSVAWPFENLKGKTVTTLLNAIRRLTEDEIAAILS